MVARGSVAVLVVLLALSTAARAADYTLEVPPGFEKVPDDTVASFADRFRRIRGARSVEIAVWADPTTGAQLSVIRLKIAHSKPTRRSMLAFDRGVASGTAKAATRHVSDERNFVGDVLFATSVDEKDDMLVKQRRIVIAGSQDLLHMLMIGCAGVPETLTGCEAAMQSARLDIPDAIDVPADDDGGGDTAYELGYQVGRLLGVVLIVAVIVAVVRFVRRRERRVVER